MTEPVRALVFVPMYNCEAQIVRVLARIRQHLVGLIDEVLVVDNGSRDRSREVAQTALADLPLTSTLLRNDDNYNLGGSHKVAFRYAAERGFTWVIVLHGDDQADPADLVPLLKAGALHNGVDALLGSRFSRGSRRQGYAWHRTAGNFVFNALYSICSGRLLVDLGSGLNAFRVQALATPFWINLSDDLTFNNQLILALVQRRMVYRYFPISWREEDQVSNVRLFRQAWRSARIAFGFGLTRQRYLARAHTTRSPENYSASVVYRRDMVQPQ